MSSLYRHPDLQMLDAPLRGRGLFATHKIPSDTLLEICPVIIMPFEQRALIDQTLLYDYYFLWGENEEQLCICLGWGSLFNHSFAPNAHYEMHHVNKTISFYAIKEVLAHEELFINYNGHPDDVSPVWFEVNV